MRLSNQNFIGTIGFAIFAVIGMVWARNSHLLEPLDLLSNVSSTTATLYDEYTETTRTRRGISNTSYTVGYSFEVNGQKYGGQSPINETPRQQMTVYYDRRNPMINGLEMKSHAYFLLGVYGFIVVVLLVCIGVIILHCRAGRKVRPKASKR